VKLTVRLKCEQSPFKDDFMLVVLHFRGIECPQLKLPDHFLRIAFSPPNKFSGNAGCNRLKPIAYAPARFIGLYLLSRTI
jgi:hypothetical protein